VRFKPALLHVTRKTIFLLHSPAALHGSVIRGMTAQARLRVPGLRSRTSISVRIMAGQASDRLADPKTAAREQSNGRESHGNGVFEFGFFAHSRHRESMALSANGDLRPSRKPSWIDNLPSNLFLRRFATRNRKQHYLILRPVAPLRNMRPNSIFKKIRGKLRSCTSSRTKTG
jgi:hypothetical protein